MPDRGNPSGFGSRHFSGTSKLAAVKSRESTHILRGPLSFAEYVNRKRREVEQLQTQYRRSLRNFPWVSPIRGLRVKVVEHGDRRIRLAEFSEVFQETGWCTKGHFGLVVSGRASIVFARRAVECQVGDVVMIPQGQKHKHRVEVPRGGKIRFAFYEECS